MTQGGARNKSGPAKNPRSRTSERAGFSLTALPSEGFKSRVPAFPLPKIIRSETISSEGQRFKVTDRAATTAFRRRELEVWREAWRTPQACAWSTERWRWPVVAEFCRLKTVVELEPDANAALVAQLHRFRDQIGLTPAGLRDNGWAIARDEVAPKRQAQKPAEKKTETAPVRRLRSVAK
jgi:hypothetical protein